MSFEEQRVPFGNYELLRKLAHGGMALVMALSVKQFFPGTVGDLALAGAVLSILVGALVGPWALRRLLTEAGEVG